MYAKCPKEQTGNERGREEETLEYSMKFHFLKFTSAQLRSRNKYEARINTQNKNYIVIFRCFKCSSTFEKCGQITIENPLWSSCGNKGQRWNEAHVNIYPITSFQVRKEPSCLWIGCCT